MVALGISPSSPTGVKTVESFPTIALIHDVVLYRRFDSDITKAPRTLKADWILINHHRSFEIVTNTKLNILKMYQSGYNPRFQESDNFARSYLLSPDDTYDLEIEKMSSRTSVETMRTGSYLRELVGFTPCIEINIGWWIRAATCNKQGSASQEPSKTASDHQDRSN